MLQLRRQCHLHRKHVYPVWYPGRQSLAHVVGGDALQRVAVVHVCDQFAVLRHEPVLFRLERHHRSDNRSLLARYRRVNTPPALALHSSGAFVIEAGKHHPAQRFEQELLVHPRPGAVIQLAVG